mmetsp:Transcript_6273/g.11375  ORF Transcript_6273/g.11375 Transcript_6273/m.11375 type:complete len:252 (-) Transcript_6273:150-905(-)
MSPRTNSASHEDLRRRDGPGREDDLSVLGEDGAEVSVGVVSDQVVSDAHGGSGGEVDLADHGIGANFEVLPLQSLLQKGSRPALPATVPLRHLKPPHAVLLPVPVVEIVVLPENPLANFQEFLTQRVLVPDLAHGPLATRAVVLGVALHTASSVILRAKEIGEYLVAAPAIAPVVIVLLRAAVVQEDVRAAAAAEDLATGQEYISTVGVLVALCLMLPVELRLEQAEDSGRDIDEFVLVVTGSGLEEQHAS